MTGWMVDTFAYTGLLIGLVLLLRRPVSRYFGPQIAYALWALPLLRFLMPPLVLPASFAPAEPVAATEPVLLLLSDVPANEASAASVAATPVGIELVDLLLPLWLAGGLLFLAWRARDYFLMRRDLLADARPVGEVGRIRLVETPAVTSPVAFGIGDKVVALPPLFMAHPDLSARDMAIAHEVAHHRGYDLVANIAAQPLLALHWFNPLAWWGWRAMRRDQEAACDARVVAGRKRSERAAYAEVIAGFAAGPHLALAAPMACPVLGEKSIIHRLRSLTMSEVPSSRRRLGIALIATSALALPLTASISYAQPEAPEPAQVSAAPAAPAAPLPPEPPLPPVAPEAPAIETVDPDMDREARLSRAQHGAQMVEHDFAFADGEFDEEEFERHMEAFEAQMEQLEDIQVRIEMGMAGAEQAMIMAQRRVPQVEFKCDADSQNVVTHRELEDGRQLMVICQTAAHNQAAMALRQAQRAIRNSEMSAEQRERILRELDAEIERMENRQASFAPKARARVSRAEAGHMHVRTKVAVQAVAPPVRAASVRAQLWAPAHSANADVDCPEAERGLTA